MTIKLKPIIAVIVAIAILFLPFLIEKAVKEPGRLKAEHIAQEVSGNPEINVHCTYFLSELTNTSNHGGFVYADTPNIINISYDNCNKLIGVRGKTSGLSEDDWLVVHIIAHELGHTEGDFREESVECHAMQNVRAVAAAWGIPEAETEEHISYYYENTYPRLPSDYVDKGACSDGGEYDLNPDSNIFP